MITKDTEKRLLANGKSQAAEASDLNLASYVNQFKDKEVYGKILTFDIVEETENVFEMKVTECLNATVFKAQGAADYGYVSVCHGDYAWAQGFNSKIKLVRDKTLMEGHSCCNHRYIIEE